MNAFALWVFSPALQGQIPPAVLSVVQNLVHLVKKDQKPRTRSSSNFKLHGEALVLSKAERTATSTTGEFPC